MSIQAGAWNFDGEPVTASLSRICGMFAEDGSDGEMIHIEGPIGLLYRPFHTTRESRLEHQPYLSLHGNLLTLDGRLDNRNELLSQLGNALQDDKTDISIVSAAFDRWGTDCFPKLIGDWALVIWNAATKELVLARDYIGVRHLFYHRTPGRLIWCTRLDALVLCGRNFTLSEEYVAGYLTFDPDAHLTPYREIHSVPPSSFIRIRREGCVATKYWSFDPHSTTHYKTDADYEEHFRHLFRQSVRCRLRTDSPVLADLSGGLDSSAIVCMADDILLKKEAEIDSFDTFSFCDRDEPDEDDFRYFTKVEERRGRIGHHAELRGLGNSFSLEPAHFVAVPGFGARKEVVQAKGDVLAKGAYRVILSGLGGDQLLGQTMNPRVQIADALVRFRLREFAWLLMEWSVLIRIPWIRLLYQTLVLLLPVSLRARMSHVAESQSWIKPAFARKHRFSARLLEDEQGSWLQFPSVRDTLPSIPALARQMTYITSNGGGESRYPYLDRRLTEFLLSIPKDQLLRPGDRRSLMRRALVCLLPQEVLARRSKASTGRCVVTTLEKQWNKVGHMLSDLLISNLQYVDSTAFSAALAALKNGNPSSDMVRLLRCLALEVWLRDGVARGILSISDPLCRKAIESIRLDTPPIT
jgi:asparagine synthase (glutamine-hydrolysing)